MTCRHPLVVLHPVQGLSPRVRRIVDRETSRDRRKVARESAQVEQTTRSRPSLAKRHSSLATTGCCPAAGLGWSDWSCSWDTGETKKVHTHVHLQASSGLETKKKGRQTVKLRWANRPLHTYSTDARLQSSAEHLIVAALSQTMTFGNLRSVSGSSTLASSLVCLLLSRRKRVGCG